MEIEFILRPDWVPATAEYSEVASEILIQLFPWQREAYLMAVHSRKLSDVGAWHGCKDPFQINVFVNYGSLNSDRLLVSSTLLIDLSVGSDVRFMLLPVSAYVIWNFSLYSFLYECFFTFALWLILYRNISPIALTDLRISDRIAM